MTGDVIQGTAILLLDHNPLTHARTSDVIEVVVNGVASRVFALRDLSYEEQLAAVHAARRAAYPPVGDQLDALFKEAAGDPAPRSAINAAIAAVKAAYPLPAT